MGSGHIGVDESGKGDYFGPLVVAACYVGPEHLAELDGVKDSKKLTDQAALRLAPVIKRTCPHKVLTIGPEKYNELYGKIRNLNRLLAWGHSRALEDLLERQPADLAISDQFADPAYLRSRLFERGRTIELRSEVRAEADIAVAAASVLARAEFLWRLRSLGEAHGVELPKGAGPQVVSVARKLAQKGGLSLLGQVAKLHFKTTDAAIA